MARRPTAPRTGDDPAAAWLSDAERQRSALYTCRRVPIFYLAITKCGSTYLKNVMYALDHGVSHPDGEDIHETERGLMRASAVAPEAIRNSPYVFTVLRDPTRRFLSMYFDKIYGDGPRNFPKLREKIAERAGLDLARGLDAEAHHENCLRFVSWIGRNIAGETDLQKNYHWRPQIGRVRRVSCFPLARLTLEGLDWQLPALLRPVEPEIGAVLAGVSERNRSAKALDPRRIISSELVAALQEVYPRDFAIHSEAASNWRAWSRDRAGDMPVPHPDPRWMRVRSLGGQDFVAGTPAADAALRVAGASLRDMASDAAPRASLLVVDPLDRLWQTLVQVRAEPGSRLARRFRKRFGPVPGEEDGPDAVREGLLRLLFLLRRGLSEAAAPLAPATIRPQSLLQANAIAAGARPVPAESVLPIARLPAGVDRSRLEGAAEVRYRADFELYKRARDAR